MIAFHVFTLALLYMKEVPTLIPFLINKCPSMSEISSNSVPVILSVDKDLIYHILNTYQ